jgi:hypothetical protein
MHGGTNPGAPTGNRHAYKHGGYTAKTKAAARYLRNLARLLD